MRLFNGYEPEEGKLAQYAGVYVLKWREEFGEPEMLFCEVDEVDEADELLYEAAPELLAACKKAAELLPGLIEISEQEYGFWQEDRDVLEMVKAAVKEAEVEGEVEE